MGSVVLSGGLGWASASLSSSFLGGSCAAASAAAAGGTRATPLPELAEPSFPPKRPSGQHLNINIWYLTRIYRPSREIYTESYFFTTKKCNFVYKIQYLHTTTRWIYSKSLQMFSTYLFKTLCK